jgi:hypothetical protein
MDRHFASRRWKYLVAVVAGAVLALAIAAGSSALSTTCSTTNPDGTRNCSGTDSFTYDGPTPDGGGPPQGCPPSGQDDQAYAEEELPDDAINPTYTLSTNPDPACGGIDVTGVQWPLPSGTPGKKIYRINYTMHGAGAGGQHPTINITVNFKRPPTSTGTGTGTGTDTTPQGTSPDQQPITIAPDCKVTLTKGVVAFKKDFKYPIEPLWNVSILAPFTYAVAIDRESRVTFRIEVSVQGTGCPAFDVIDLLPAGFKPHGSSGETDPESEPLPAGEFTPSSDGRQERVSFTVPAGRELNAVYEVDGQFVTPGVYTNQAHIDVPGHVDSNTAVVQALPLAVINFLRATGRAVSGQATDNASHKPVANPAAATAQLAAVKRVDVAVRRLDSRAARKRCLWVTARGRRIHSAKKRNGTCLLPVWMKARGTSHWSLKFARPLPRGRYRVQARTTDGAGVHSYPGARHATKLLVIH